MANTNAVKIEGSKSTWPARLDGKLVEFPTVPDTATFEEAVAFVRKHSPSEEEAVNWIRQNVEADHTKDLKSHLNGKAREEGKTYTRDELKKIGQRSETITDEELAEFGKSWKLSGPRKAKSSAAAIAAAEAKAARIEADNAAMVELMLAGAREMSKAKGQEYLEKLIAMKMIPEGTTL